MATSIDLPLSLLRTESREMLSMHLNTIKVVLPESNLPRDYRGVLRCIGLNALLHSVELKVDPMSTVLDLWQNKRPHMATIGQLRHILGMIDRWDVVDETNDIFAEDIKFHLVQLANRPATGLNTSPVPDKQLNGRSPSPTKFDAFILFHTEDIEFATLLIDELEACGLKIFVKERDLSAGNWESDDTMHSIFQRCDRVIVLYSSAYAHKNSNLDDFLLNVKAISADRRTPNIVPISIHGNCPLPVQLSKILPMNYQPKEDLKFWCQFNDSMRYVSGIVPMFTEIVNNERVIDDSIDQKQPSPLDGKFSSKFWKKCFQKLFRNCMKVKNCN